MNRREFVCASAALAGSAALAVEDKTTDGGFAEVSWPERVGADVPALPPGAHGAERFAAKCVGCGLCAAACPSKCLRPSTDLRRMGRVELDFRHGWCRPGCVKCGEVCPSGAIARLSVREKRLVHVGHAVWTKALCLRAAENVECHACEKHCPVRAISIVGGFPSVDRGRCIGCGACEHYCPARPRTAIRVEGFEVHREVRPISEADLVAEMGDVLYGGKSCVVARDGVISDVVEERGVRPLLGLLDGGRLGRAVVMVRVCGRAAAAIFAEGGAAKVIAPVMSKGARELLEAKGAAVVADEVVDRILNREKTGGCPMEEATNAIAGASEVVAALRAMAGGR